MNRKTLVLLAFVIAKFLLQYQLISPGYDLHRDEYLHLDQGSHLDWGYLSVPPVTGFLARLIQLLGNGVFWVKFFPALFGALTIVVAWKTVQVLKGGWYACVLAALSVLLSVLLRLNTLFQPNSLDVLCWVLLCYTLIKYIDSEQTRWLYLAAVVFAVGFLNKYNICFLAAPVAIAILLTPQRAFFLQKHTLYAVLMALLLVSPNLWWQYKHHFPVVHHMQELAATQLVNVKRSDFLKTQLIFFAGSLPVWIAALPALLIFPPFWKYRFMFFSFIMVLALFTYLKAKDYYAIGLYPIYLSFGAVWLESKLSAGWKKHLRWILYALPLLLFVSMFDIAFPNKTPQYVVAHQDKYRDLGLLRWEDGKNHPLPQDFADMLGWKALADTVDAVYATMPDQQNTMVICDNYGETGAINYYRRNKNLVACSFHADYANWITYNEPIKNVILVKETYYDRDRQRLEEKPLFDTVYLAAQRINPYAREDTISIYVLRGAKTDISKRIKEEQTEELNSWR